MKKAFSLFFAFCFAAVALSQIPFLPIGAGWVGYYHCDVGQTSYHYYVEVTQDTVIQGKYCTLLPWNGNSSCYPQPIYIHQDGHRIYRYDIINQEFKLEFDFSKQVGESWTIEFCKDYSGIDSATVTVEEIDGPYRRVSAGGKNLSFYEGFGGVAADSRLLISPNFFIFCEPCCYHSLICYQDPTEGVLYGGGESCMTAVHDNSKPLDIILNIYPNPSFGKSTLEYQLPFGLIGQLYIIDRFGRRIAIYDVVEKGTLTIADFPAGIYYASLTIQGHIVKTAKLVKL